MATNLHKKTLNLRRGDWEYLEERYSVRGLFASVVVRYIVSQHVDSLKVNDMVMEDLLKELDL